MQTFAKILISITISLIFVGMLNLLYGVITPSIQDVRIGLLLIVPSSIVLTYVFNTIKYL